MRKKTDSNKKLRGTDRSSSSDKNVLATSNIEINPPSHLSEAEKRTFQYVLENIGSEFLRSIDSMALSRYCVWLNIYLECRAVILENGLIETTQTNSIIKTKIRPEVLIMEKAEKILNASEANFGFNLKARLNLVEAFSDVKDNDDIIKKLLNR